MTRRTVATVSVEERGYRVRLETSNGGPTRAREIKGASCAALADATALILALMIDPAAVSIPPADAGAPLEAAAPAPTTSPLGSSASAIPAPSAGPSPAPTTPAPALSARPPLPPAPDPPSRFSTGLFAMGALDLGTLPGVSPGVLVGLSVLYGPLRAELAAALWPAHDATLAARPTAGGAVDLYAGSAAACWRFLPGRFELGPCLGLEIGRLRAQGFGVSDPGQGSALWAAWRAGGGFAYRPIAPLVLGLRLEVAVPFARPGFVLSNVGTVHRPSVAAGRALAGLEVRF